jgi:hypothetical protein
MGLEADALSPVDEVAQVPKPEVPRLVESGPSVRCCYPENTGPFLIPACKGLRDKSDNQDEMYVATAGVSRLYDERFHRHHQHSVRISWARF